MNEDSEAEVGWAELIVDPEDRIRRVERLFLGVSVVLDAPEWRRQ